MAYLSPIQVEQNIGKVELKGENPADAMISVLGRRGVTLDRLKKSFEKLKFQQGLQIIGYPYEELQSEAKFQPIINLIEGERLELACYSNGFPYPNHSFFKNGSLLFNGNPFIIENVRFV